MTDWSLFYAAVTAFAAVLTLIGGALVYFTRLIVKSTLADFRAELLDQLNGRYLKTELANALIQRADERYAQTRADVADIYRLLECRRAKG